jgi:DNA-3-methyladenine glycosylase II
MKSAGSSNYSRKAVAHLKKVDPVLAQVIDRLGAFKGWTASNGTHFDAVCRSIVFQQLSGKAAGTIHGRFQGLYGGRAPLRRSWRLRLTNSARAVGLSRQSPLT